MLPDGPRKRSRVHGREGSIGSVSSSMNAEEETKRQKTKDLFGRISRGAGCDRQDEKSAWSGTAHQASHRGWAARPGRGADRLRGGGDRGPRRPSRRPHAFPQTSEWDELALWIQIPALRTTSYVPVLCKWRRMASNARREPHRGSWRTQGFDRQTRQLKDASLFSHAWFPPSAAPTLARAWSARGVIAGKLEKRDAGRWRRCCAGLLAAPVGWCNGCESWRPWPISHACMSFAGAFRQK